MNELEKYVFGELGQDKTGHSYLHAKRVAHNATLIQKEEGGNEKIIIAASFLHDTIDPKLFADPKSQEKKAIEFLRKEGYSETEISSIVYIIDNLSWHTEKEKPGALLTLEGNIVRDADRLEALGAIGIVRCVEYGASKGRDFMSEEEMENLRNKRPIRKDAPTSLAHFYDKLLLLEAHFVTPTGKRLARKRSQLLTDFLEELKDELD